MIISAIILGCTPTHFPEKMEISNPWHFRYDSTGRGMEEEWFAADTDFRSWPTVPSGNLWRTDYDGSGWFTQEIWLPELISDRDLALVITSVADNATVWMNDSLLAIHKGRGELFFMDITDVFKPRAMNRITIFVEDTGGPGGLTGKVYLQKYIEESELIR
ncbi:MAG: hypothetical protein K9N46_15765 [Candidatus Marinimicrobia bacterium]|nr:hypothetical protein [Candidatus Neomarinimicrobiota bacterium]MCF7882188.1 hypothetical protein [Candidatus Neomarinimicrobiota bacterium]